MQFIQARWFRQGGNEPIVRVVLHDMEYPEKLTSAEDVAAYFARVDKKTSAHYCVDTNSIVQCVRDYDGAYHAPPNQYSIGIEHAGYARQTTAEWLDEYGTAMLRDQSAPLVRGLCAKHGIPMVWLTVDDLLAGKHGITSHNNVSLAFGQSTHTDPGPNFPVDQYMAWINPTTEEPDMTGPQADQLTRVDNRVANLEGAMGGVIDALARIEAALGNGAGGVTAEQVADELAQRLDD